MVIDFPEAAIGREVEEFGEMHVIEANDASCPEGSTFDGGVKDVDGGFRDGAFGSVFCAERDGSAMGRGTILYEAVFLSVSRR